MLRKKPHYAKYFSDYEDEIENPSHIEDVKVEERSVQSQDLNRS